MAELARSASAYAQSYNPYSGTNYPNLHNVFIPEVWSGTLIEKFYAATVFGAIANTDYEGEIKTLGDTVKIRQVPDITISDYTLGAGITYEVPTKAVIELEVNKAKSFAFQVNKVDEMQADIDQMSKWAEASSEELKVAVDSAVLAGMLGTAAAANRGADAGAITGGASGVGVDLGATTTPVAITKDNAIEFILRMGLVLDEQNVPETGRWVVIPARYAMNLKASDLKDASITGDGQSVLRNGRLGMIDRFEVFVSNQLPRGATSASLTGSEIAVYAGHKKGLTFASQILDTETLPNPADFGSLVRGLQVFGQKTVKPEAIAEGVVTCA